MSEIAIKVEGLGKKYKIGSRKSGDFRESFGLLWNRLKGNGGANPSLQINQSTNPPIHNEFWALKDIDFEIKHGEAVGIIGRNGAGKSTLLKILSRITKPTTGRFEINGRVSSLLEVGTGFHKELTGRENIFLNGAILGMTRREIKQKFDEIVDFSGVEQFIDTPVKHYSSGMLVRLAFSVAAHLEPEILIIDEVLAVGDAEFQKKCLGKMEDVTGQGRTVLFVSHNMGAVKNLCGRGIVLKKGGLYLNDKVDLAITRYLVTESLKGKTIDLSQLSRDGHSNLYFERLSFKNSFFRFGEDIVFSLEISSYDKEINLDNIDLGVSINDELGNSLIHCTNGFINRVLEYNKKHNKYRVEIENNLKPGNYTLTLFLRTNGIIQDWLKEAVSFEIVDGNPYGFNNTQIISGKILPLYRMEKYV